MGYFSNGSEGDWYRSQWCDRCANDGDDRDEIGCAVMDAHLIYNYDQHKNESIKALLTMLIPRDEKGFNAQCRMFREKGGRGGGQPEPLPEPVLQVVKATRAA